MPAPRAKPPPDRSGFEVHSAGQAGLLDDTGQVRHDLLADDGLRRRDAGTRTAELNTWAPYRRRFLAHIERLPAGSELTSDDVVDAIGPPVASSKNALGGLVAAAAKAGLIEAVGFAQSRKASRHGGYVRLWRRTVTP